MTDLTLTITNVPDEIVDKVFRKGEQLALTRNQIASLSTNAKFDFDEMNKDIFFSLLASFVSAQTVLKSKKIQ